jgi:hypothetical protein
LFTASAKAASAIEPVPVATPPVADCTTATPVPSAAVFESSSSTHFTAVGDPVVLMVNAPVEAPDAAYPRQIDTSTLAADSSTWTHVMPPPVTLATGIVPAARVAIARR